MRFNLRLPILTISLCQIFSIYSADVNAEMDVLTVTSDRFKSTPDQQLTVINTIDREELNNINPKSVVDALETLPGVSVIRSGGASQKASISIRGTDSGHVLVLVDGVRIGSATSGEVNFSSISPENIERIEVVKGPRAAIWGSDAVGGVIQIFTRKLEGGEWIASAEYGSDAYMRASAGIGITHGEGSSTISLNREKSDGYDVKNDSEDDDDGYDRFGMSINGQQPLNQQWQLTWTGLLDTGSYKYDNSRSNEADNDNYLWNIGTQYQNENLISKLSFGQSRDKNENYRGGDSSVASSLYETTREQISWSNRYTATDNLTVIGGVDWFNETITNDYPVDERDLFGLYALTRYELGKFLMEGVVRYDDVDSIDSKTSYNASLAYEFNDQWRLSTGAGTAFKVPTFNDLYTPDKGNPDLAAETSKNVDITLNYASSHIQGYLSLYQNKIENLIEWAPNGEVDDSGYDIWKPANVAKAEISGLELSLNYNTWDIKHRLGYSYIDAIDGKSKQELVGRSKHEFDYSISYAWSEVDLLVNYHYQGKRRSSTTSFLDPYHKVDVGLGYLFVDSWQLRLKLNNLFDEEIISNQNYFSPGRQVFLSMSYQDF